MKSISRRDMLRASAAAGLGAVVAPLAACGPSEAAPAAGGGAPIRIGFIPLTDCASVVMAGELGLYAKQGVNVVVEKQASWPIVRDKLASGELDAAHCLFGARDKRGLMHDPTFLRIKERLIELLEEGFIKPTYRDEASAA